MKSFLSLLFKTFIIFSIIIFTACGSNNTENRDTVITDSIPASTKDSAITTQDFFYSLPSPLQMVKIFKRTGLKYVEGLANSPDNISKYSSAQSKTLNLGVYSADLAYSVLNKQMQPASRYMESIKRLSDDLGMSSLFATDDYLNRFKNNLNNEDSLIRIVSKLKEEMDIFMKDNGKEKQTLLMFMGAWVENMYIATQLTKEVNKEKVAMRVAEQKYVLNSLMNVSINFRRNDEEFKNIYGKLNELKSLFDNLTVQSADGVVTMDKLQLQAITEKTRDLRNEIVN